MFKGMGLKEQKWYFLDFIDGAEKLGKQDFPT